MKEEGVFDYLNIENRLKISRSINIRQGQHNFRNNLLSSYRYQCAITGCDYPHALEACHIYPYMGPKTNSTDNGILLRSDIHTLFDLCEIGIDLITRLLCLMIYIFCYYKIYRNKKISLPEKKLE